MIIDLNKTVIKPSDQARLKGYLNIVKDNQAPFLKHYSEQQRQLAIKVFLKLLEPKDKPQMVLSIDELVNAM